MSAQTTRCRGVRRYKVEQDWGDAEVTLDVDHRVLTIDLATQLNKFWTGAEERLEAADGDVVMAVVKMAAAEFLGWVLDVNQSLNVVGMQKEFDELEGWCGANGAIRIADFDGRPDLDSELLRVTELEV
ncbi:DUF2528 family protein [Stenotrophomonas maltophilia]|uniref:DUF2528 family protein n=1 Tax=Stenotrophomonas maltophilia TaxID=40324 RepID=UPI00130F959F|nr:DUF2528 family protein [Stenotrophomonas maltophilia]MBH1720913.1 DUF2528 family protein [Stenotrophomonas maltophilia]MBH1794388.1 DUF2528 family protein [Stenotrophomonas maltophilia]